jgi:hypothetical protein
MTSEEAIAHLFRMDEKARWRHSNPWNVHSRFFRDSAPRSCILEQKLVWVVVRRADSRFPAMGMAEPQAISGTKKCQQLRIENPPRRMGVDERRCYPVRCLQLCPLLKTASSVKPIHSKHPSI